MEPEWSDFKVLLALARAGSVAGAARELQVNNSTVSRRLAALEDAVGATLIIRGGRDFNWTAQGRTLLKAAESMASAAAQATHEVHVAKADVEGTVRISVVPALVPILMRLMLPALRAKHPGLTVELSGDYQRVDLAKGESDVAVRMARPEEPDLVACRAFEAGWFAYASKAYLDAHGRLESHAALAQHRLVLYVEPMHSVAPLRWMEAHRGSARPVFRVDNLEIDDRRRWWHCRAALLRRGCEPKPGEGVQGSHRRQHGLDRLSRGLAWGRANSLGRRRARGSLRTQRVDVFRLRRPQVKEHGV